MSTKIDKLTPEQEAAMQVYVDKWTKIGLSTEPTNRERAARNVKAYYEVANLKAPLVTVFATSPLAAQILGSLLSDNDYINYVAASADGVTFTASELAKLINFENSEAAPRFFTSVATTAVQAAREVSAALNLGPKKNKVVPKLSVQWQTICGGNLWAGWQAFYDFFKTEVKVPGLDIIEPTLALSQDVGWIVPYEKLCILTEKPTTLSLDTDNRLHKDGGPSIAWSDGYEIYTLHGTQVPRYMAVTSVADLDPKQVLSETNVEVRLQGVKKIGPARLIESLGAKVVDKQSVAAGGAYELLNVNWTGSDRRYLRMINPSTGETCIEPVHPDCNSVEQALGFRMSALIGETWNSDKYTYTVPKIYT